METIKISKSIEIPKPDESNFSTDAGFNCFTPEQRLNDFIQETILDEDHELFNIDHIHLIKAHIGFLWTDVVNKSKGRIIAGQAEIPMFRCGKWQKARQEKQIEDWFGRVPDFIITLSVSHWFGYSDIDRLALLEHELYHCGQALNGFGMPKFSKTTGQPIYAIRGHDYEEFIGVVRRYGIKSTGQDGIDLIEAALEKPIIGEKQVDQLCGNCV